MFLQQLRRRLVKDLGGKALWTLEKLISRYSLVETSAFLDPYQFAWVEKLEQHWRDIRGELDAVLQLHEQIPNFQDISVDQRAITTDNKWKTYFLYGFGYKAEKNCERCPETTRLIEEVPGMKTAFFSILSPGKHIPEHRGLYKGFLRYHMGLMVPEPGSQCWIRVNGQQAVWEEGKSMMFDDTYPHEVRNDTDGVRVVLFMDILRPLRFPVSLLNDAIIKLVRRSGYIQEAKRNQERWERRLAH